MEVLVRLVVVNSSTCLLEFDVSSHHNLLSDRVIQLVSHVLYIVAKIDLSLLLTKLFLNSLGTSAKVTHPKKLRCETLILVPLQDSSRILSLIFMVGDMFNK